MKQQKRKQGQGALVSVFLGCVASALLTGCSATGPKTLYQWEDYNGQVYEYLKGQEKGPEAQIIVLEEGLEKINAAGNTPPPGYHAQLGLLYAQLGKGDRMARAFEEEKKLFPESTGYMNFLLKKHSK